MPNAAVADTPIDYRALAGLVRQAGLMERRTRLYALWMALILAAFAAGWAALVVAGNSWLSLVVAAFLAVVFTQADFIGHDAGHQQIFRSRRANHIVGLVAGNAMTGLGFGWWVPKHQAHHTHPNVIERDPDIGDGVVALSFTAGISARRRGAGRVLARYQAWLFFPLLLAEGIGLHISGAQSVFVRRDRAAAVEGILLAAHIAAYLTIVFWVLSPLHAVAFIAVQQGLFGLYLGCSFAPNHKGMPVMDSDDGLGFVRQQVMTARNVTGGKPISFLLGGLNYQIEHHLFPGMPRPNLAKAQGIVKEFCAEHGLAYHSASLFGSYRQALMFLNRVGAAAA